MKKYQLIKKRTEEQKEQAKESWSCQKICGDRKANTSSQARSYLGDSVLGQRESTMAAFLDTTYHKLKRKTTSESEENSGIKTKYKKI